MNHNKNSLTRIVASAVEETFAEMAFVQVYHLDGPGELPDEQGLLKAGLLVHDPFPGEICLAAPRSLVADVAAELFSTDQEDITDSTLLDLLSELVNTIAGRVMNEMTPEGSTFRLGLPETGVEGLTGSDGPQVECHFEVEGEIFSVAASGDPLIARGESC